MAMREISKFVCTLCGYSRSNPWGDICPACRDGQGGQYSNAIQKSSMTSRLEPADTPEFRAAMTGGSPETHRKIMERR